MDTIHPLIIVAIVALIHASFQLSVSVQTLLSSHTIGARRTQAALLRLSSSFAFGALVMTMLCLSFSAYVASNLLHGGTIPLWIWAVICGLLVGLAVALVSLYYRKAPGTTLWIPQSMANFLRSRAKGTKTSAEAFSLGLTSILAELIFIATPTVLCGLILTQLTPAWQLAGVILYAIISTLPLLAITALINGGYKISSIQRWRETNKGFLQFAAGGGLLVLGFYLYVEHVTVVTAYASGGF